MIRAGASAALLAVAAACTGEPSPPEPRWEAEFPGLGADQLVVRPEGVCFVLRAVARGAPNSLQCVDASGVPTWRLDDDLPEQMLAVDRDGHVVRGGQRFPLWIVESRDGTTGALRWSYSIETMSPLGDVGDLDQLVTTAAGNVVLNVDAGGSLRDSEDAAPIEGDRFLISLAGADGRRRWREELMLVSTPSIAADGDDTLVVTRDRLERRDDAGALVDSQPFTARFSNRTDSSTRQDPSAIYVGAGGTILGTPPAPGYLVGVDDADTLRFNDRYVTSDGAEVLYLDLAPAPDGGALVLGRFLGDLELTSPAGSATLRADTREATSLPFERAAGGYAMPFVAAVAADGALRGALTLAPDTETHLVFDAAVSPSGEILVLHAFDDTDEVLLSAYTL